MQTSPSLTLTSAVDLTAVIPSSLGFHPVESLVVVCLRNKLVGPVARADLPDADHEDVARYQLSTLITFAQRHAEVVALFAYSTQRHAPGVLQDLLSGMLTAGVGVLDAVVVGGGMATFLPAPDGSIDDPVPLPDGSSPVSSTMAALNAFSGRVVLPDREALAATVSPPVGIARYRGLQAMERAADELLASAPTRAERVALGDATLALLIGERASPGGVQLATAARLAVLIIDTPVRDSVIREACAVPRPADDVCAALLSAVALIPAPEGLELLAVLAIAAFRNGQGVVCGAALDICLDLEPDHVMAGLVNRALTGGAPPGFFDQLGLPGADTRQLTPAQRRLAEQDRRQERAAKRRALRRRAAHRSR